MVRVAAALRRRGLRVGFVPTMGALHEGHRALIRAAARETHVAIVSIFVNPLQFGPREDYRRYPRTLRQDLRLARKAGASVVFVPSVRQMDATGQTTYVEVHGLSEPWEGTSRPGHFRGVATIVTKLFHLVQPTVAYFGLKDYQQALVVQRLVRDLGLPVEIRTRPTVREPDGLAMSSRNRSLSRRERQQAIVLFHALRAGQTRIRSGERDASRILARMRRIIRQTPGVRVDYLAIVDRQTLQPRRRLAGRLVILGAVWVGPTRLIDNVLVAVR